MLASAAPITISDQFWPTIATVVPVLALALIVEARATITHWDHHFPWLLRSIQSLSWAYVLIQFAIVEVVAFNDLAGNERSTTWVDVAKGSIIASLSTLILTPTLSLLGKANAGAAIRVLVRVFSMRAVWKHYRAAYRVRKSERELIESKKKAEILLSRNAAAEKTILASKSPDSPEAQRDLVEIAQIRTEILKNMDDIETGIQKAREARANVREAWKEFREARGKLIRQVEGELGGNETETMKTKNKEEDA